ncbi:MAG: aspartate kinase [Candidatus Gracilibacteria bacterium]|nr:aspartate kinase [Candidatus Gracilibacteria bacterium]
MKILKFGGTSLGSLEMIQKTANIVVNSKNNSGEGVIVVVSAMSHITNTLIDLCELARLGKVQEVLDGIEKIKQKHQEVAYAIGCEKEICSMHINIINNNLDKLHDILKGVSLLGNLMTKDKAKILYFGEILSSILLSLAINKLGVESNFYKSADLIVCLGDFMNAEYDSELSLFKTSEFLKNVNLLKQIPVITGFGGGDESGNICLFDRGGSDYVATILGNLFDANIVEIWTDVDGVMSADPRVVKNPIIWDELDYSVSAEFALAGAKVLHPKTISPAIKKNIPVYIKNTFNPTAKGTKICRLNQLEGIKGINIDNSQVLITFVDNAMIGGVGYLYIVMELLKNLKISIDAVATSETSFTISIKQKDFSDSLVLELENLKNRFTIKIDEDVTKISIVGDNINDYSIFSELDNIKLITKGNFNKTLTIFIGKVEKEVILNKLHNKIFG